MGRIPLIALFVVLLAALGPAARAAGPTDLLPDLVADPPDNSYLEVHDYGNGQQDLLLRFDGYIHNAGAGALDIRGTRSSTSAPMTPLQRVYDGSTTGYHDDAMPASTQLIFVNADGHNHWHLQNVARYSLWNEAQTQEVAPAMKVGFCLDDSQHVDPQGPSSGVYTDAHGRAFCKQGHPEALDLFEGVSAGWRDLYSSNLTYQWVIVSSVQPGVYRLREDVDTGNIIHESNETNAPAYADDSTTIPGYVAKSVAAPAGTYGQPQQVTLDADTFGAPAGPRRFKLMTAPAHGTLDVATGTPFAGPAVTYTPAAGYSGPDSFKYVALTDGTQFPRNPASATVTLSVGTPVPSVAIDGAPSSIETGHGVQLNATVSNDADGVVWSVNGLDGGDASVGTISSSGFYTAPAAVPPGGSVTIAARSLSGAHDERTVAITETLASPPAPAPPEPSAPPEAPPPQPGPPSKPSTALGPIAVGLSGHVIVARVTPRVAGRVALAGAVGKRVLGHCHTRLAARERFSCRMRVPRHMSLRRLKVEARLTGGKGALLGKRTFLGRPRKLHG